MQIAEPHDYITKNLQIQLLKRISMTTQLKGNKILLQYDNK